MKKDHSPRKFLVIATVHVFLHLDELLGFEGKDADDTKGSTGAEPEEDL